MFLHPKTLLSKIGFDALIHATLNFVQTFTGEKRIESLEPTSDPDIIQLSLERMKEMMTILQVDDTLPFSELPDITSDLQRAKVTNSILNPDSILWIGKLCSVSRLLSRYFKYRSEHYPLLNDLARNIVPMKELEESISRTLTEQGNVKDSASRELSTTRRQLIQKRNEVRTVLQRIMRQAAKDSYMAEENMTLRNGRMVIPVKAEHKRKISGFIHDVSSTGQTVYLEPAEALNINNDVRQLESEEQREIERILQQLTRQIGSRSQELFNNFELIGDLDAIHAKAQLGMRFDANIPQISTNEELKLVDAYNPILLLKTLGSSERKKSDVIPLTLELEKEERCVIITGPNAGGKSVAMKTLGLCSLMLQCGYPIPVQADSRIPVFDGIFVDLGDDQSIENDLSTFSSHLAWIRDTLKNITSRSLILIDEAGSGTDPEEGSALYQAFIETLLNKHARIVATTHHGSLKVFAHNEPGVINGSMEFDQSTLSPTYRFHKGLPGSSYAFEIAVRLGIQKPLISRAKGHLGSSKSTLESLIIEMEHKIQEADTLKRESEILAREADSRRNEYEDKRKSLINQQEQIREKALIEARDIILNANKKIEEAVQRIKEEQADSLSIKDARKTVQQQRETFDSELEKITGKRRFKDSKNPPDVGDIIRLSDGKSTGELLEVKGNNAIVLVNGMKLKTDYRNLVRVIPKEKKKSKKEPVRIVNVADQGQSIRPTSNRLDIRGFRGDEAISTVTQFIDRAVASGLNNLEIIHGKGYGILKQLVHDYLKTRPEVKHFELAPWDQGGPGCTYVELN